MRKPRRRVRLKMTLDPVTLRALRRACQKRLYPIPMTETIERLVRCYLRSDDRSREFIILAGSPVRSRWAREDLYSRVAQRRSKEAAAHPIWIDGEWWLVRRHYSPTVAVTIDYAHRTIWFAHQGQGPDLRQAAEHIGASRSVA